MLSCHKILFIYHTVLSKSKRTKKLYNTAKDYVAELLEDEFIEGGHFFSNKALQKILKDAFGPGVWRDYLTPKVQQLLRLIISRDPVC